MTTTKRIWLGLLVVLGLIVLAGAGAQAACPAAGTSGNFSICGGYLYDPGGSKFIVSGTNVIDNPQSAQILQNSSGFPISTLMPHINYIRVNICGEGACNINGVSGSGQPTSITYPSASNYVTMIARCQAAHIVCEFEDHSSNGGYWEGGSVGFGQSQSLAPTNGTGTLMTSVTTFWKAMATQCIGSPYCWIGTFNEMATGDGSWSQSSVQAVTTYGALMYNAIRGTGNNNVITLQSGSGAITQDTMGPSGGTSTTPYATMTNVIFRIHYYTTDTVANIETALAGNTTNGGNASGCSGYLCQQQVQTKDGQVPIIFNEFGSSSGSPTNTDGANIAAAITNMQANTANGSGSEAYGNPACAEIPGNVQCWTQVNNAGTSGLTVGPASNQYNLTTWGGEAAAVIAANPFPGGTTSIGITAPGTLAATQSTSAIISGVSASDTTNPNDTMTFQATASLNGKLTASGATGNGTGTITFTGSLTNLNNLLATVGFTDAVIENPVISWAVSDQHTLTATASTAVTVSGPVSANCTIVTTVGPTITSIGPPVTVWAINSSGQVVANGSAQTGTSNVVKIAYVTGLFWQENTSNNWYSTPDANTAYSGPFTADPTAGCAAPPGQKTRVPAPQTGTITTGTWVINQTLAITGGATQPSTTFSGMRYNYLLPAGYNPTLYTYPLVMVGAGNDQGMNGSTYPRDGGTFISAMEGNDFKFNTVNFRTANPAIFVAPQCDQTGDLSGATTGRNCGGYNDTPNGTWNEQSISAIQQHFINDTGACGTAGQTCSVDTTRLYGVGLSLSAIGYLAQGVDNNQINSQGNAAWTAIVCMSCQLFRPATANSVVYPRMKNVPYMEICSPGDNPCNYGPGFWDNINGNTSAGSPVAYPTQTTYDNGTMASIQAGTSSFYYINSYTANANGSGAYNVFGCLNSDGCDGTKIYNWLFQQIAGTTPPPSGSCPASGNNLTLNGGSSAVLTDASGNGWGIPKSGGPVYLMSTQLLAAPNATQLAYVSGVMWYKNSSGQWFSFSPSANILAGNGAIIASGPTNVSPISINITAPQGLAATQNVSILVPNVSVSDATNPGDTATFTGASTGNGKLTGTGMTGNGTGTVTFAGTFAQVNQALATVSFLDSLVENPTITWTIQDAHSLSASTTTNVTVSGTAPPSTGTSWDSTKNGAATLSNNNKTMTTTGLGATLSTSSKNTGKVCFQVNLGAVSANTAVGIASGGQGLTTYLGGTGQPSIAIYPTTHQRIYEGNGTTIDGPGPPANSVAGDVVTVAEDIGTNLVWFTDQAMVAAGLPWNNAAGANPVGEVSGISTSFITNPYFIAAGAAEPGSAMTINTAPISGCPTGFPTWDAVVASGHSPWSVVLQ